MIRKGLKNKNDNFMKLVMYSISLMNTTSEVHVWCAHDLWSHQCQLSSVIK